MIKDFFATLLEHLIGQDNQVNIDTDYQSSPIWPAEWYRGLIQTQNQMGVMYTDLGPAERGFIRASKTAKKPLLDIGAAYGVATRAALLADNARVTACDIYPGHLHILEQSVPEKWRGRLRTTKKRFPNQLSFKENSLSSILMANLLNYLKPDEVELGLKKAFEWLEPEGTLWISVLTPFFPTYQELENLYDDNVEKGERFPCQFNPHDISNKPWSRLSPEYMQIFKKDEIQALVKAAGFGILECHYFAYDFMNRWLEIGCNNQEFIMIGAKKPA